MKLIKSLLLVSALAFATTAFADHDSAESKNCKRHSMAKHFEEADTDHDGTLDKAEAQAIHSKHFDEMDADKDGTVSKEEMAACKRNGKHDKGSKGFEKADKDKDGTLTKEEAKNCPMSASILTKLMPTKMAPWIVMKCITS